MLRLLSSKAQGRKSFFEKSEENKQKKSKKKHFFENHLNPVMLVFIG